MWMKSLILLFLLSLVIPYLTISASGQEFPELKSEVSVSEEGVDCYKTKEINASDISFFRDRYVPVEYYPESFFWRISDIAMLVLLLALGLFITVLTRPAGELTILCAVSLLYFGIIRGGCICPVGSVTDLTLGLKYPEMSGVYTGLIFLLPMLAAFFAGRIFCTSACPIGAVQHLLQKRNALILPRKLIVLTRMIPPLILVVTIWLALRNSCFFVCSLDPYKPLFFAGNALSAKVSAVLSGAFLEPGVLWACGISAWCIFIVILIIGYWLPRPFCRILCPYGVILGLISLISLRQRMRPVDECSSCGICKENCPIQAIQINRKTGKPYISNYDCVQCGRCLKTCKAKRLK